MLGRRTAGDNEGIGHIMGWALCGCEPVPTGALAGLELLRAGLGDSVPSCLGGSQRPHGNGYAALGIFAGPPPGPLPRWDCIVWRVQISG